MKINPYILSLFILCFLTKTKGQVITKETECSNLIYNDINLIINDSVFYNKDSIKIIIHLDLDKNGIVEKIHIAKSNLTFYNKKIEQYILNRKYYCLVELFKIYMKDDKLNISFVFIGEK